MSADDPKVCSSIHLLIIHSFAVRAQFSIKSDVFAFAVTMVSRNLLLAACLTDARCCSLAVGSVESRSESLLLPVESESRHTRSGETLTISPGLLSLQCVSARSRQIRADVATGKLQLTFESSANCSRELAALLQSCVSLDARDRPSSALLLQKLKRLQSSA